MATAHLMTGKHIRHFGLNPLSCNFTFKVNSHTSEVETQTGKKLRHFYWPLCCKSEAIYFVKQRFVSVTQAGMFMWRKDSLPGTEI